MERPSIAMIPSAYKDGIVYSVLPINGSADLDFARATSATLFNATRVESDNEIQDVASNTPRLDYSGSGCPSLLLEPESTNLLPYSKDFSQWVKSEVNGSTTIISNNIISPNGENDATRINCSLTDSTTNNKATLFVSGFTGLGANLSSSFYLKSDNEDTILIRNPLNNGSYETVKLTKEWKRYNVSINNATTGSCLVEVGIRITGGFTSTSATFDIFGAQLEEQSYATSYIPTSGAIETRAAETLSKSGLSNYINSSEGVLYLELNDYTDQLALYSKISLSDGSDSYIVSLKKDYNSSWIESSIGISGVGTYNLGQINYPLSFPLKYAIVWDSDSCSAYSNGVHLETKAIAGFIPINTLNELTFGRPQGGRNFYGSIKDLRVYTTALTDEELTQLTS